MATLLVCGIVLIPVDTMFGVQVTAASTTHGYLDINAMVYTPDPK
jgi:hypothetical protein